MKNTEVTKKDAPSSLWLEAVRTTVPVLWFVLAVIAFFRLYPVAAALLKAGVVNKVKVGLVEVELAHVTFQPKINGVAITKEALPIDPVERKRITERFDALARRIAGANVLWVDNNHPYQNVSERRVLLAAGIGVDTARSTEEAVNWITRARYDVVITDASRPDDQSESCNLTSMPPSAGCALLKRIGQCFEPRTAPGSQECSSMRSIPGGRMPAMLVYTGHYESAWGAPLYAVGITDRPSVLFDLVLNALENRPSSSDVISANAKDGDRSQ